MLSIEADDQVTHIRLIFPFIFVHPSSMLTFVTEAVNLVCWLIRSEERRVGKECQP